MYNVPYEAAGGDLYSVPTEGAADAEEAYAVVQTGRAGTSGGYLDISADAPGAGAYGGDNYDSAGRSRTDSVA